MSQGFKLLTPGNPKTEKGRGAGYWTFILHLAPWRLSGFNVCPMAESAGCIAPCLNTAGRGGIMAGHGILTADDVLSGVRNTIQHARIRRTRLFFEQRDTFMSLLVADIRRAISRAERKGYVPVFRLNGTSDIRWETLAVEGAANLFALFPAVQFYDYTKIPNRRNLPANYHLTFSAGRNETLTMAALQAGCNVAVVFRDKATVARYQTSGFHGHPVFVGDDTDLRFFDPREHVIALYAKGNARRDTSGFVRD